MTAEISVMNRNAIALAADSAVTISGEEGPKIFTSANKIFQLSKYEPVGIMMYQNTNFLGVPWETIIKNYREYLGKKKFRSLNEYADNFISYLESKESNFTEDQKIRDYENKVASYYFGLLDNITNSFAEEIKEEGEISKEKISEIIDQIISDHYQFWKKAPLINSLKDRDGKVDQLEENYKELIVKIKDEIFSKINITSAQSMKLTRIALSLFTKSPKNQITDNYTGIVIAGYGDEEIFPSLKAFKIEGLLDDILKFSVEKKSSISTTKLSSVIPFAQGDMVHSFMNGIEPSFFQAIKRDLMDMVSKYPKIILDCVDEISDEVKKESAKNIGNAAFEELKKRIGGLEDYSDENYTDPIVGVVSALPKPELASMAESLVNLTNLRRKISMGAETVGGPIDVAVISRGDGFIWINRKHYFEPELNHHFFNNYYMEDEKND